MAHEEEDHDEGMRPIVRGWPAIAFTAWEGYCEHGPGAVFLIEEDGGSPWVGEVYYSPLDVLETQTTADLKETLMLALVAYEPLEQVVLVYQDQYRVMRVMTLSGELSPPESHDRTIH